MELRVFGATQSLSSLLLVPPLPPGADARGLDPDDLLLSVSAVGRLPMTPSHQKPQPTSGVFP